MKRIYLQNCSVKSINNGIIVIQTFDSTERTYYNASVVSLTNSKVILEVQEPEWIDLGLPSGTLWAKNNEEGYYTYNEMINSFGRNQVPTIVDFAELIHYCKWTWVNDTKEMKVTGPNNQHIYFPAIGYCSKHSPKLHHKNLTGYCWSISINPSNKRPYYLHFGDKNCLPKNPLTNYDYYSCSVHLCKH